MTMTIAELELRGPGVMSRFKKFLQNKFLLSFFAGTCCALAFAPINFFPAAIISLTGFFLLLETSLQPDGVSDPVRNVHTSFQVTKSFGRGQRPRPARDWKFFWLGFFYGFGYFLAGIYWIAISLTVDIATFGWLIPFALTLIPGALALYLALMTASYKILIDKFRLTEIYQKILLFALLWLAAEILRSNLFTGFPWNLLGYAWMFDVAFAQLASVFGVYGLSVFAVLVCLFPVIPLMTCRKFAAGTDKPQISIGNRILTVSILTFFLFNAIYGYEKLSRKNFVTGSEPLARLVQANIKQEMKWDAREKHKNFARHLELTNSRPLTNVEAVIWSESSLPFLLEENSELIEEMKKAVPLDGVLISGAVRSERDEKFWNSIFVLSRNGIEGVYDKHHLVPFGEYVPLQKYLPFVQKITDGAVGFSEGEGAKTLGAGRISFSPLVCYEAIFSREVVEKNTSPDFFVNLTNDAWFGTSSGPYQHLNIARMRSIEYGIPLIRVAGTGISALVDPFGRIVAQLDLNEDGILDVPLIKKLPETFYSNHGHLALILLVAVMMVGIVWKRSVRALR